MHPSTTAGVVRCPPFKLHRRTRHGEPARGKASSAPGAHHQERRE